MSRLFVVILKCFKLLDMSYLPWWKVQRLRSRNPHSVHRPLACQSEAEQATGSLLTNRYLCLTCRFTETTASGRRSS